MQDNKIDIEKIIESINKKAESASEPTDIGLVFEVESPEEANEPAPEAPKEPKAEEPKSEAPLVKEEFSVPDAFSVSEEYNTPQGEDYSNHIHMTYVPRFTDASEKYRMRDGNAPVTPTAEAPRKPAVETDDEPKSGIDPTAETTDVEVEGAVVVDMTRPTPEDSSDMLNVYKFAEEVEAAEPEEPERTVEDEREEIESLLDTPTRGEEEEPTSENEPEAPPKKNAEDYELPDPDIEIKKEEKKQEEANEPTPDAPKVKKGILLTEYTLAQQRDSFVQRFLDTLISQRIRLFASLAFSILLLGFEISAALGVFADRIFGIPVTSMAVGIIDLLLAGCTLALALPEALNAVRRLFSGRLLPSVSIITSYVILAVYYLVVFAMGGVTDYPLFGFIYSISACVAIISSAYRSATDFEAFKLISKTDDMQVAKQNLTRDIPCENIVLDGLVDEYKSYTVRARSCTFINDFVRASGRIANQNKHVAVILGVSFGVSVISAVIAFFAFGGLLSAISTFAIVNMLGAPAFMLMSHSASYYDSQKTLMQSDSCACGELAYYDLAKSNVIVFDDVDIFGPDDVNLKRYVFLGEGDSIDGTLRQMCSLFSVVGGPLGALFTNALDNRITTKRASNPEIEEDGLSGDVGTHRVSAGTAAYMIRHGVEIPEGVPSDNKLDTTKIIYASEDGRLSAKFYVRYSFSEEFTMVLPLLKKEGIVPLIYTRDPNINDELLKLLTTGIDSMRVMKLSTPVSSDESEKSRGESATVVTAGDKMDVAGIVLHSKKHARFSDRLGSSEVYASAVGSVLAVLLSFFGMLSVPAFVFSVWQISWCFVMRIAGRRALAPERQRKGKSNE